MDANTTQQLKDSLNNDVTAITPPHELLFYPTSTHTTPSPRSALQIAEEMAVSADSYEEEATGGVEEEEEEEEEQNIGEEGEEVSLEDSLIDYDYLLTEEEQDDDIISLDAPSSPDYDYLAAAEDACEQEGSNTMPSSSSQQQQQQSQTTTFPDVNKPLEAPRENEYEYVIHNGEEYILGTLMVRVLQAKNVKLDHRLLDGGGGGLGSLLSNHRRNRHSKNKLTPSPLSAGALTPNSNQSTLYSKLTFHSHQQYTDNAVPAMNGDYHWSRGDQSYFDVVCPSYPRFQFNKKKVTEKKIEEENDEKKTEEDYDVCCKKVKEVEDATAVSNNNKVGRSAKSNDDVSPPAPLLNLSVFAKRAGKGGKKQIMSSTVKKKGSGFDEYDGESQYVGQCTINITRVLTGKTPYFDEWCTLHNDNITGLEDLDDGAGRVRVVIEYEPTDSPPRSGDVCIFANIYPDMEKELYPIPLYSVRTNRPVFYGGSMTNFDKIKSASNTTLSSIGSVSMSSKSTGASQLIRQPKQFHVEESVGDHVVLSYKTPENWKTTFEIHRYNLLVTHRYCGTVEKVQEGILDLCDNLSQSPLANVLINTAEVIPDEGLVFVGAEAVRATGPLVERWMQIGFGGALEDVIDAANLDGRYSHLSDDEEEEDDDEGDTEEQDNHEQGSPLKSDVTQADLEEPPEDKKALPGMPDCPITGQPMIDPVVAADGHTYERYAIARWFQTSNKSPLTGAVMSHANLVPNYMLLSSIASKK